MFREQKEAGKLLPFYFPFHFLLHTTHWLCFVGLQTANLDGETNLKIRKALEKTWDYLTPEKLSEFKGCGSVSILIYTSFLYIGISDYELLQIMIIKFTCTFVNPTIVFVAPHGMKNNFRITILLFSFIYDSEYGKHGLIDKKCKNDVFHLYGVLVILIEDLT